MKTLNFTVHGKVQGVWFRAWTRDMAREMGVLGWVRNKADGNVEGAAQGGETVLTSFLDRLHDGPPLARVTTIDSVWSDAEDEFSGFEVRA
ncbi:MAG: acylphosphatase [Pseudodesulfovibrio sp.]